MPLGSWVHGGCSWLRLKPTHAVFINVGGRGGEKHGTSHAPSGHREAHHAHKPNAAPHAGEQVHALGMLNSGRDKPALVGGVAYRWFKVFSATGLSTCGKLYPRLRAVWSTSTNTAQLDSMA